MRIAIVNDVAMAVEALQRVLCSASQHEIAWVARDGREAVERCAQDTPDLILMDLIMPGMDGVEATRRIMARTPCAILIVTASVDGNSAKVFEALGAGAVDVVSTPVLGVAMQGDGVDPLLAKLRVMERLISSAPRMAASPKPPQDVSPNGPLVVIGASAGGPAALATILGNLPPDFPSAIVIVQHVDAQFAFSMASWLDEQCPLQVRLAREGDQPRVGTVLLAGTNDHLVFTDARTLGYIPEPVGSSYRPSVDVFFESVARRGVKPVIGVLLTGMGRDGAKGLKLLRDTGARTIAQDRATCVVYGMPKAAVDIGAAIDILPLDEIASGLLKLCNQRNQKSDP